MFKKRLSIELFRNITIIIAIIFFIQFCIQVLFLKTFYLNNKVNTIKNELHNVTTLMENNGDYLSIIHIISNFSKKANASSHIINYNEELIDLKTMIKLTVSTESGYVIVYLPMLDHDIKNNDVVSIQGFKNNLNFSYLASFLKVNDINLYGHFTEKNDDFLQNINIIDDFDFNHLYQLAGVVTSIEYPVEVMSSKNDVILEEILQTKLLDKAEIMIISENTSYYLSPANSERLIFLSNITLNDGTYTFINVIPIEKSLNLSLLLFFNGSIFLVLLVISTVISAIHSHKFTKPISNLYQFTSQFADLNINEKFTFNKNNEIKAIADNFKKVTSVIEDKESKTNEQNKKLYSYLKKELYSEKCRNDLLKLLGEELQKPYLELEAFSNELMKKKSTEDFDSLKIKIKANVEKTNKIINDLITIKELNQQQYKKAYEVLDLKKIVEKVLRELDSYYSSRVIFQINLTPNFIFSDKYKMTLAIKYMIINSIKLAKDNNFINISLLEKNNRITFSIQNISNYLPEEKINLLFQPYNMMDKVMTKVNDDSLLNMYIVKLILEEHKAEFGAFNDEIGIVYYFYISKYDINNDIINEKGI